MFFTLSLIRDLNELKLVHMHAKYIQGDAPFHHQEMVLVAQT